MSLTDNEQLEYTKCAESARYFIETYVNLNRGTDPIVLTTEQVSILNNILSNETSFIETVERQTGVTTIACAYLLWYITFNPDKTVMVSSHNSSATRWIANLLLTLSDMLPQYLKPIIVNRNPSRILFQNGTRVLSNTPTRNSICGMDIDVIYVDNYRYVRDEQFAEFYTVASAPNIKIICTSTG